RSFFGCLGTETPLAPAASPLVPAECKRPPQSADSGEPMSGNGSANSVDTVDPAATRVAVIGLGVMGHTIATRLLQQLGTLVVTDLRRESADDLVADGAEFHDGAAAAAAHSDIVVLSLNTAPIVEQVVFGAGGVLAGWADRGRPGLIVDMSSIAPERTREFAARVSEQGGKLTGALRCDGRHVDDQPGAP